MFDETNCYTDEENGARDNLQANICLIHLPNEQYLEM